MRTTTINTEATLPEQSPATEKRGEPLSISRPSFIARSLFLAGTIVVCLGMLEAGLRISGRYLMDNAEGYFAPAGISYGLKKNFSKQVVWPTMTFKVNTSDQGYRAAAPGPQNIGKRPYYVTLGASDVFGNGLDYESTFVGILAERLKNEHNMDLANLGVAGHHLIEQTEMFRHFLSTTPAPPKAVLVIFNPLFIGGYDDTHPTVTVRRGDLFEQKSWRIALLRKVLSNTSAAYCFFRDSIRQIQQRYTKGEDFALSFYIERFSAQHRIHRPEVAEGFLKELKKLDDLIRSVNATPIFVYCPPSGGFLLNDLMANGKLEKGLVDTQYFVDIVRKYADAQGVRFIDLHPPVQARYDKGEKLNFERDGHYNGPTSKIVGEYLYEQLRPAVTTIP
jgi:hypothetical protein